MRGPPVRFGARALLVLALCSFAGFASAHESGGTQLPKEVATVTDEGARAKAMAADVEAGTTDPPADVVASLARTRQALSRANGAHAAGDARTARLLGNVALGWAEAAKAQAAATRSERASGEVEKATADLSARRDRGRALITESQARRGQLASQIERKKKDIEAAKAPPPPRGKDKAKRGDKTPPIKPGPTKPAPAKPAPIQSAPLKGAKP